MQKQNQEQRQHKAYAKQNMKSIQMYVLTKALQRGKALAGDTMQTNNTQDHRDVNLMRLDTLVCRTLGMQTLSLAEE